MPTSTVKVVNPGSDNHIVVLYPGQFLKINFNEVVHENQCSLVLNSDWLELEEEIFDSRGKSFIFKQKYDFSKWSKISKLFLGKMWFSGLVQNNPTVYVYLESVNPYKQDVVTLINPDDLVIKVYPQQILEVVYNSMDCGENLKWNFNHFHSSNFVEIVNQTCIDSAAYDEYYKKQDINDGFYIEPRVIEDSKVWHKQYHWWFRIKKNLVLYLSQYSENCSPIMVYFDGLEDNKVKIKKGFRLMLNQRFKNGNGWSNCRSCNITKDDSLLVDESKLKRKSHKHNKKKEKHRLFSSSSNNFSNHKNTYQGGIFSYKYSPNALRVFDVGVSMINSSFSLDSGCKLISDEVDFPPKNSILPLCCLEKPSEKSSVVYHDNYAKSQWK